MENPHSATVSGPEGDQGGDLPVGPVSRRGSLQKKPFLTTLSALDKEWKISFDFNPKSYKYKGYAQIKHFTTGGKGGKVGDQTPALWTLGVYIVTTLNGKPNIGKTSKKKKKTPLNKWTTVEISQVKKAA